MFRLMLEAGLRVSEIAELRRHDVDMAACRVTIRDSKGGKDRQVWVTEDLRDRIGEWLERRPNSSEAWMFPTRTAQQTSPRSIRRSVKTYAERAELKDWKAVSPHTLRHTFATNLLQETGNIRLVQKALGHARLSTTMIYTHIVDEELEAAMRS
jgi:site-specific recombinase XerD